MNANYHFGTLRYPLIMYVYNLVYLCQTLLELLMMNANSCFGTLRHLLIIYTVLFTYIAHYSTNKSGLNFFYLKI